MTVQTNPELNPTPRPQTEDDFCLTVENFILSANPNGGTDTNTTNEIRLFLLTLLNHYKHSEQMD